MLETTEKTEDCSYLHAVRAGFVRFLPTAVTSTYQQLPNDGWLASGLP